MNAPAHRLAAHMNVPGARVAESGRIAVPVHFHPEVFELLRKRAQREGSCFGDVVAELVEQGLGG